MNNFIRRIVKRLFCLLVRKEKFAVPSIVYNNKLLEGRLALVSGGTSGIGLEIARAFLKTGAKVVISGSSETKLNKALDSLQHENLRGIIMDVAKPAEMNASIEKAASLFPGMKISILVNSAGVTQKCSFYDLSEKEYDKIMEINVKGVYFLSRSVSKYMIENGVKGNILNISSSSALKPAFNAYQLSKWAIRGFTVGLAEQLAPYGITVNAIAPGKTFTSMMVVENETNMNCESQPCGRYIDPKEVANLAVFMCSNCGSMIMGYLYDRWKWFVLKNVSIDGFKN